MLHESQQHCLLPALCQSCCCNLGLVGPPFPGLSCTRSAIAKAGPCWGGCWWPRSTLGLLGGQPHHLQAWLAQQPSGLGRRWGGVSEGVQQAGGGRQAAEAWGVRVTGSRLGWWAREGWGGRVFHGESRPETCHQGAPSTLHVASAQLAQPPATMGGEETSCPRRVYSCWKGFGFRYCCWDFVLFCFVSFFLVWLVFFLREGKKKFVIISSKAPIIYL